MAFKLTSQLSGKKEKTASPQTAGPRFKLTSQLKREKPLPALSKISDPISDIATNVAIKDPGARASYKRFNPTGISPTIQPTKAEKVIAASDAFMKPFQDLYTFGGTKLTDKAADYAASKIKGVSPEELKRRRESLDAGVLSPTARNVANIAGSVVGIANPTSAAYKTLGKAGVAGLSKVMPNAGKLTTEAVRGASAGLGVGALEGVIAGDPLSVIAKKAVIGMVGGAILDPAVVKLGQGVRRLLGSGKLETIPAPAPSLTPRKSLGKLTPKNTALEKAVNRYNEAVETVQNHFQTDQLRADEMLKVKSELGIDFDSIIRGIENAETGVPLNKMAERGRLARVSGVAETPKLQQRLLSAPTINATPKGGINTPTPQIKPIVGQAMDAGNISVGKGPKERQFAQSVRDSQIATDDIKQNLKNNRLTYEPITNKETFEKATKIVNDNPNQALEYFNSPSKGVSADDVALGEALITKAIKEGNPGEADRLIADLAEKLTTAGQAVQAASIFKRLTPEGMLMYAHRVVNSTNKDLLLRKGLKAKKVTLTPEDSTFILETMKKAQSLPDGREKDIAIAQVMQLIADKAPATLGEKVKGLQRISLLLNPKTMARNIIGNTLFGTVDNLSNVVATPIDKLTSKLTGMRTTTLPSLKGQFKSGLEGAKHTIEDVRLGIDTSSASTQFDLPNKRIFETKVFNALDKATKTGLQLGDRPFYKAAYDDVLRQQMKLSKATEPTQEMIEQAHKIAQQRTYQDVNALTNAFKMVQTALNGGRNFGLGNIVVPFVKTPANILKRAIEYSPIGVEKAIREAFNIGKGTFDQKTFVDSIARSVTGTALIMVGYDIAKRGIITGSGNKDKDVAAFERGLGKNDFAFKYGDNYYTYDWAQPASMALAVGADIYLKGKDRTEAENVVFDAVKSGGETLFKQSLLQGVQRFMGGYSPIDNLANTAINAPTQFVPTLSKQITQVTDPTQRSTYSTSNLGTGWNLIKAKIPWASKTLQPKVNTFGNTVQHYQGDNSLFNIFLNPGNYTEFKPNRVQKEIMRIFETTGEKDIFPKVSPKYFTFKGEKITLTPEEITGFQRTMGKATEARMNRLISNNDYALRSNESKAKALARAIEFSYDDAKRELLSNRKTQGN